jgi:hypothetical protein
MIHSVISTVLATHTTQKKNLAARKGKTSKFTNLGFSDLDDDLSVEHACLVVL